MKLEEEIKQKKFKNEYQKLLLNVIFTGNWLNSHSIKAFKPYGLSPQQYNVLRILKGQYPNAITVNKIAERMLDKNSNASRLIDKLVAKELVIREICPTDRRQMDVLISDKGVELLEIMNKNVSQIDEEIKNLIDEVSAKKVNEVLDKLREI